MKTMMLFVVAMVSVLFTTALASEITDYDFEVYSWEGGKESKLKRTGLRRRLQVKPDQSTSDASTLDASTLDESTLDESTLDESTLDESTSDKSDDWPYESDDGPPIDKLVHSVLVILGICMFVSLVIGVVVCLWCVFLRRSPKDRQHLPEPTYVITPPHQVFTISSVVNVV